MELKTGTSALKLRAFGTRAVDLQIDFNQRRPHLVTGLLRHCLEPADEAGLWDLEVGQRLEWLLRIALASGPGSLTLRPQCRVDICGQPMEVELTPNDLFSGDERPETVELTIDNVKVRLRRPRGRDQRAWLEQDYTGPEQAARCMAANLISQTPPEWERSSLSPAGLETLDQMLMQMDPLPAFRLQVCCPHCGQAQDLDADLETAALRRLHNVQKQLIRDVHRLASRYHWTEHAIVALPAWRREAYLNLIERDENQL